MTDTSSLQKAIEKDNEYYDQLTFPMAQWQKELQAQLFLDKLYIANYLEKNT